MSGTGAQTPVFRRKSVAVGSRFWQIGYERGLSLGSWMAPFDSAALLAADSRR